MLWYVAGGLIFEGILPNINGIFSWHNYIDSKKRHMYTKIVCRHCSIVGSSQHLCNIQQYTPITVSKTVPFQTRKNLIDLVISW